MGQNFFVNKDVYDRCLRGIDRCEFLVNKLEKINPSVACYDLIGSFLNSVKNYAEILDEYVELNISQLGVEFCSYLDDFLEGSDETRDYLFVVCYRMTTELSISRPDGVFMNLGNAYTRSHIYAENLGSDLRAQVRNIPHQMVVAVARRYIHHPSMAKLPELPARIAQAEQVYGEFEKSLDEREKRVEALQRILESYEDAFNFVGLYDGFRGLRKQKNFDSFMNLALLWAIALGIAALPLSKVISEIMGRTSDLSLGGYLTFLGLELILIFFFRVCLHNYKSVKAQLLQIDLRMTLCQFVQSYATYAKEIRSGDKDLLLQFEKVVFSGIVTSEDAIPSTFDGLEKIAELIKALKAK